jgi:hypothetical protein
MMDDSTRLAKSSMWIYFLWTERRIYWDPSIAVAGKRSVRSENIALSRKSDGGMMQVCRTVVGSSWSSYWSRDSVPPGAGWPGEVLNTGVEGRTGPDAGRRLEGARVVANTSCFGFKGAGGLSDGEWFRLFLDEVFGLVDLMPDRDAVI